MTANDTLNSAQAYLARFNLAAIGPAIGAVNELVGEPREDTRHVFILGILPRSSAQFSSIAATPAIGDGILSRSDYTSFHDRAHDALTRLHAARRETIGLLTRTDMRVSSDIKGAQPGCCTFFDHESDSEIYLSIGAVRSVVAEAIVVTFARLLGREVPDDYQRQHLVAAALVQLRENAVVVS